MTNGSQGGTRGTEDSDIESRQHLLIDIDSQRPANTGATDAEHNAAIALAKDIRYCLNKEAWPEPLLGDSGNGAHLIYRLPDLPNTRESLALVTSILKELADRHNSGAIQIDQSVVNASRISKLYGTLVCKGENTVERPHRLAKIIESPNVLTAVPLDTLQKFARYRPHEEEPRFRPASSFNAASRGFTMEEFLARHAIQTRSKLSYRDGYKWQLDCPFNPEHKAPDAALYEFTDGTKGFKCSHNSCTDRKWQDFRRIYEPNAPVRPQVHQRYEMNPVFTDRESLAKPAVEMDLLMSAESSFNDFGNAARILRFSDGNILYSQDEKSFYVWDGRRFEKNNMAALKLAQDTMLEFLKQAYSYEDYRKFAVRSLDQKRLDNALAALRPRVMITPKELDPDSHLLNFLNCTVDLRTGEHLKHSKAYRITRLIHHNYNPRAQAPVFLAALERILPGLVTHVQRVIGYSLTGDTSEKVVFIAHGETGNNGKTTLLDAIRSIVPEYSVKLMIDSLMVKHGGNTNNSMSDLSDLRGARFANTSETESGQRLSESVLKRITQGMGTIKSMRKYENGIEFPETHKLWIDANHLPVIKGSDNAIWRRLHVIPFEVELSESQIDRSLPLKFAAEAEGILAWIVEGARLWYTDGLSQPNIVRTAAENWREDMDIVAPFLAERCNMDQTDPDKWVEKSSLYEAYAKWCETRSDRRKLERSSFFEYLTSKGYKEGRAGRNSIRCIRGITIRPFPLVIDGRAA